MAALYIFSVYAICGHVSIILLTISLKILTVIFGIADGQTGNLVGTFPGYPGKQMVILLYLE